METIHNSTESFNELVFENRNKLYGAYIIRKSYNDNLSSALFYASILFGIVALTAFLFTNNNVNPPNHKGQIILPDSVSIFVDVTPHVKPELKIEKVIKPQEIKLKSDNLNLLASDDKKNILEKTNTEADIIKGGKPDGVDSIASTPDIKIERPIPSPPSNEPQAFVTEMPEFKGNLFKYIIDNIKYPWAAKENFTSGTVVVQFVVENDGSIDNLKVLNPIGDGCTEEAIRVIKSMPKWKPGKNHGEPVRVLFNLPIKFTIK